MRTNNDKVRNIIISVYFILIVLAIILATVFSAFSHLTPNPLVTFFILVFSFGLLFFIVHFISKYFEYDSDGLKVVVTNKGLLLSDHFNYREHRVEFSKDGLIGFKFNNYLAYKELVLLVKDKHGHTKKERFNVSLVSKKKRKYIRQSLTKMIKLNRKPTD
ncbi:hypothetical protein [Bizionia arctica]|uniref:Uncharacterized protein n=1 Tax=Bizionia arctica TaxID=1495645 RepID=A0A917GHR2_9FLAO|nr:hypothetical protein [Bizionia arctica]GGG46111.1 hypothetical protein GCM10010976_17110 [Bizionia arctica]